VKIFESLTAARKPMKGGKWNTSRSSSQVLFTHTREEERVVSKPRVNIVSALVSSVLSDNT
jgi:hypothetical protein